MWCSERQFLKMSPCLQEEPIYLGETKRAQLIVAFRPRSLISLDTYHCKYLKSNSTLVYLLGIVCSQHKHPNQIWWWVLICTLWLGLIILILTLVLTYQYTNIENLASKSNSTLGTFSEICLWSLISFARSAQLVQPPPLSEFVVKQN